MHYLYQIYIYIYIYYLIYLLKDHTPKGHTSAPTYLLELLPKNALFILNIYIYIYIYIIFLLTEISHAQKGLPVTLSEVYLKTLIHYLY